MSSTRLSVRVFDTAAVLGQHRSTQRAVPMGRADEDRLAAGIVDVAWQYETWKIAAGYRGAGAQTRHTGPVIAERCSLLSG